MNTNEKIRAQLGMNISTARSRLRSDILFKLAVQAGHKCHRCGSDLDRETFTIEHKIPWLDSHDPIGSYFDLENIAFSHLSCNSKAGRKPLKTIITEADAKAARKRYKPPYDADIRRVQYLRTGQ